ncbi:CAP domain-containing protein [Dactylosporangium roseum]|uniref:CAP domain-containing protein n=1 Tax=Dactylosporangium roseum TaxID=47989 RepID=A0ABY5Z2M8_9ACTN|nr:CAP domain-containing protein [Dactylosporangium roseum]
MPGVSKPLTEGTPIVTRFARRATAIAAALVVAPLGLTLAVAAVASAAPVAVTTVQAAGATLSADLTAATKATPKKPKKKAKKKKKSTPAPTPAAPTDYSVLENQVVTLTNNYRTANGCGALRIDSRLVTAARAHSTDMVSKDFFSHTGSDGSNFVQREARAGYTTGASAENIAWGYRTPQDVVNAWINSSGHRANILNCSSVAVGVGVAYKADGTPYWTQDFGR